MLALALLLEPQPSPIAPPNTDASDNGLIAMWLYGKLPRTIRAYRRVIADLQSFTGKPFAQTRLSDLQAYVRR